MAKQAYYTTDTGELAPYPNMTSDDLRDFERWCKEHEASWSDVTACAMMLLFALIGIGTFIWHLTLGIYHLIGSLIHG